MHNALGTLGKTKISIPGLFSKLTLEASMMGQSERKLPSLAGLAKQLHYPCAVKRRWSTAGESPVR
jgi:hypothetical protein